MQGLCKANVGLGNDQQAQSTLTTVHKPTQPYNYWMFAVQDTQSTAALVVLSRQLSAAAGLPVQLLAQIGSTNQTLLDNAAELPQHPHTPCALMALSQSAGRGRRGRTWTATENAAKHSAAIHPAFLASIGIRCTLPLHTLGVLPLHIGVAVVQQLNQWGCAARLKWPNDIVIATAQGSAKLGGILVESRSLSQGEHALVMGMGLNWHSAPALTDKLTAGVLEHAPAHTTSAPAALTASAALLATMTAAWQRCADSDNRTFTDEFAALDALYGLEITALDAAGAAQHGTAKGINAQGHLGLQLGTGQLKWLHSGEVSVRLAA